MKGEEKDREDQLWEESNNLATKYPPIAYLSRVDELSGVADYVAFVTTQ